MSPRTQKGDLRDKVAAFDPATAAPGTDSEAAGARTPGAVEAEGDRDQARAAWQAVPKLDANRAVDTADHRRTGSFVPVGILVSAGVIIAVVAAALHFTLPG